MSQEALSHLATDEIVTKLLKRFEKKDENVDYKVIDSEKELLSALPNTLTRNDSEALLDLIRGMGFSFNVLNPAYAIFDNDEQGFAVFQIPVMETFRHMAGFPRDFSNMQRNLTWNRKRDGTEILTITSLLKDQVVSARYTTGVDPELEDGVFSLTHLDMSETADNAIKFDRYPVMHAGLIPMQMLIRAYSQQVKRVFDIKRGDNPDLVLKPRFMPHVLNPRA